MGSKACKIKDLKRIRYTTSHPRDFTNDLIKAHGQCDKLMPLIHLPVQSGSNKILDSMNRRHTIEDYLDKIKKLKNIQPNIKFSSDFIIGYPGENREDFEKTLKLLKEVKFINSFSFVFNARPGTPAASLKKIDDNKTKDRLKEFQEIAYQIKKDYRKKLYNTSLLVLFENLTKVGNNYFGRDEFFNSVIVSSDTNLVGQIRKIKVKDINRNTIFGAIDDEPNNKEFAA